MTANPVPAVCRAYLDTVARTLVDVTPGNWHVHPEHRTLVCAGDEILLQAPYVDFPSAQDYANAALAAEAPDMLRHLCELVSALLPVYENVHLGAAARLQALVEAKYGGTFSDELAADLLILAQQALEENPDNAD